jgi:nucleotide-binding universal stress UspA family protein
MYETIVVGTDGSETARAAVSHAAALAQMSGAVLHVVCAYKTVIAGGLAPEAAAHYDPQAEAEQVLEQVQSELAGDGLRVETHAVPGAAAESLCEVADRTEASLIVVGSRGMTSARRFVLGSVPNRVSHSACRNVLIVHTN